MNIKPIPQLPKRLGNTSTNSKVKHHLTQPRVPKRIEEKRDEIKLYAIMEHIEDYKGDTGQLIDLIRLINQSRHAKLVTPQLLAILGIDPAKNNPNLFTADELLSIVIFLYEATIQVEPTRKNATMFEQNYGRNIHVIHYYNPTSPVKEGVSPTYCHTISAGFESKEEGEAMMSFLYTSTAMEEYGIRAIGYRTEGFRTSMPCELKIWCSHTRHHKQNELINLLGGE